MRKWYKHSRDGVKARKKRLRKKREGGCIEIAVNGSIPGRAILGSQKGEKAQGGKQHRARQKFDERAEPPGSGVIMVEAVIQRVSTGRHMDVWPPLPGFGY